MGLPVFCAAFHYPTRSIVFDRLFETTDDYDADMVRLREQYRPFIGKNRGTL